MIKTAETVDISKEDDILVIKGILICLSSVEKIIEKEKPKIVKLLASKWIMCDSDITAPNTSLVMISPIVVLC